MRVFKNAKLREWLNDNYPRGWNERDRQLNASVNDNEPSVKSLVPWRVSVESPKVQMKFYKDLLDSAQTNGRRAAELGVLDRVCRVVEMESQTKDKS